VKFICNKGITPYAIALVDMDIAAWNVTLGAEECVMIVEHEGVYSAGKSFREEDFVGECRYQIYYSDRGGRVTIHNPGQIVVYPIINLLRRGISVSEYVKILERWMIDVLEKVGIEARLSNDGVGVWTNDSKVGFVGIRIKRGVSTHGLCVNVCNDTSPFDGIIPCGIRDLSVTSISKVLMKRVSICEIANMFIDTCPF
jgi:lipoyl(octanoyl) transferase